MPWNRVYIVHCALCTVHCAEWTLQSHWSAHSQCKKLGAEVERGKCREERGKPRVECKKVNGEEEIEGSHGSVNLLLPSSSNSIIATVILFINTDSVTVTIIINIILRDNDNWCVFSLSQNLVKKSKSFSYPQMHFACKVIDLNLEKKKKDATITYKMENTFGNLPKKSRKKPFYPQQKKGNRMLIQKVCKCSIERFSENCSLFLQWRKQPRERFKTIETHKHKYPNTQTHKHTHTHPKMTKWNYKI